MPENMKSPREIGGIFLCAYGLRRVPYLTNGAQTGTLRTYSLTFPYAFSSARAKPRIRMNRFSRPIGELEGIGCNGRRRDVRLVRHSHVFRHESNRPGCIRSGICRDICARIAHIVRSASGTAPFRNEIHGISSHRERFVFWQKARRNLLSGGFVVGKWHARIGSGPVRPESRRGRSLSPIRKFHALAIRNWLRSNDLCQWMPGIPVGSAYSKRSSVGIGLPWIVARA